MPSDRTNQVREYDCESISSNRAAASDGRPNVFRDDLCMMRMIYAGIRGWSVYVTSLNRCMPYLPSSLHCRLLQLVLHSVAQRAMRCYARCRDSKRLMVQSATFGKQSRCRYDAV